MIHLAVDEESILLKTSRFSQYLCTLALTLANHPASLMAAQIEQIQLAQAFVRSGESGVVRVRTSNAAGSFMELTLSNRLGEVVHQQNRNAADIVVFTIPPQSEEKPLLLTVRLAGGPAQKRVYSVVDDLAQDVRYGFYTKYENPNENFSVKGDILADLHINAVEYYDYFRGHGYYAPEEESYTHEPFNSEFIHTGNIQGKAAANRARNIANIAYIAAYSAIPEIASETNDFLLNEAGTPLVFYEGSVGTEQELGGVWFRLMAFAPDTEWYQFLIEELGRALDDSLSDKVQFEGFEVDTYGYQGVYNSSGSEYNGQSIAEVLALFCEELRARTREIAPHGLVTTNTIAEDFIESVYTSVDFLFVENWAYHKTAYEEVMQMGLANKWKSNLRLVTKSYPADTSFSDDGRWPAANLRNLMAAHIAGGSSLMAAGEPDETTGRIGALNTLYYPTFRYQTEENYQILRDYNAHDAALFGRNHGAAVRPWDTDLVFPEGLVSAHVADDGAVTWNLLNLSGATDWDVVNPEHSATPAREITLTLPNRTRPAAVLYGTPEEPQHVYPEPVGHTSENQQVTLTLPAIKTLGTLIVEPQDIAYRLHDRANARGYRDGWTEGSGDGEGFLSSWRFSGIGGDAGVYIGDSTQNDILVPDYDGDINTGRRAWSLFSGNNGLVDAQRSFPAMAPGETFGILMDNGFIRPEGAIGFDLRDGNGNRLFGFEFIGGEASYRIIDSNGTQLTEFEITGDGLDIAMTREPGRGYTLRVVPIGEESRTFRFSGELAEGGEIEGVRLFSFQAGVGPAYDVFFNDIAIYTFHEKAETDVWTLY